MRPQTQEQRELLLKLRNTTAEVLDHMATMRKLNREHELLMIAAAQKLQLARWTRLAPAGPPPVMENW